MRLSRLGLTLLAAIAGCAGSGPKMPPPAAERVPQLSPQQLAWQVYQRVERGEAVPRAEVEAKLGAGQPSGDARTQWTFPDSDDFLVLGFDAQARATSAYWGLSYGARSKAPSANTNH